MAVVQLWFEAGWDIVTNVATYGYSVQLHFAYCIEHQQQCTVNTKENSVWKPEHIQNYCDSVQWTWVLLPFKYLL